MFWSNEIFFEEVAPAIIMDLLKSVIGPHFNDHELAELLQDSEGCAELAANRYFEGEFMLIRSQTTRCLRMLLIINLLRRLATKIGIIISERHVGGRGFS